MLFPLFFAPLCVFDDNDNDDVWRESDEAHIVQTKVQTDDDE